MELNNEERRAKLNLETAQIPWLELQRFFASGSAIKVSPELDLLDVACTVAEDNGQQVEAWISDALFGPVTDAEAGQWFEDDAMVWAVVLTPWVLVQPVIDS